jgi:PAS domain-containing protein
MQKKCAWCDTAIVSNTPPTDEQNIITHGICASCSDELLAKELGVSLHSFLDRLGVPVLAIEPGPRVQTANRQACDLLGKDISEVQGQKGGDLIECEHARRPGGCGETIHCKSCTIRNTVLETFATGHSFVDVLAYLDVYLGDEIRPATMKLSTEKVGGIVLLRIDDFEPQYQK